MTPVAYLVSNAEGYRAVELDDRARAEHLALRHHGTVEPLVRQRDVEEWLKTLHGRHEPLPKAA